MEKRIDSISLPARKNKTNKKHRKTAWPEACLETRSNLRSKFCRSGFVYVCKSRWRAQIAEGKGVRKDRADEDNGFLWTPPDNLQHHPNLVDHKKKFPSTDSSTKLNL